MESLQRAQETDRPARQDEHPGHGSPPSGPGLDAAVLATVNAVDRDLSEHPLFGDSSRILTKVLARYRFGLGLFAEGLPSIRPAAAALAALDDAAARTICFDPLVRLALEAAFSDLEDGRLASPHRLEQLLPLALTALPLGLCQSRMSSRWPVADDPPKWLWDLRDPADPQQAALRALFEQTFAADTRGRGTLIAPDAGAHRSLGEATALLHRLLPHSGAAALRHVETIALLSARSEGGTVLSATGGDLVPSTVFVSLEELGNVWDIAGCLLHEGLHMKLFDAARLLSVASAPAATIQVPWRPVRWSIVRAVFAYHVYVHLSLFKAAAVTADRECLDRFGDPHTFVNRPHAMSVGRDTSGMRFGRSIDRARYLGGQLEGAWSPLLSAEGRELVRWLRRSLAPLERAAFSDVAPQAPVSEGRLHKPVSLRTHPVPQAEGLLALSPTSGKVQWLDLGSWLLLELGDGRTPGELEQAYVEVLGNRLPAEEARRHVHSSLTTLLHERFLEQHPPMDKGDAE
jgi:hypothetical protein